MMETIQIPLVELELKPGVSFFYGKHFWRILDVDEKTKTMLVISEKAVCDKKYNKKKKSITWEQCTLRKWLNEEFINEEFSEEEREAILVSHLKNPDNPKYGTKGGNDTDDKIFLLSIEEALQYFKDDVDRVIHSWWWLRTAGCKSSFAAYACSHGDVDTYGSYVTDHSAVRPAFRVDLQSEIFRSRIIDHGFSLKIQASQIIIEGTKLIESSLTATKIIIPEGVTIIGANAFEDRKKLKNVKIPNSVQTIEQFAFAGCESLTEIDIPEGVTEIGMEAFIRSRLERVHLPSTLKKIGKEAFYACSSLIYVEVSNSILSYGKDCFWMCDSLKYTPEMFRTAGKLNDEFIKHIGVCGKEELAWIMMYQKDKDWDTALSRNITKDNADDILKTATEHISGLGKSGGKPAGNVVNYIINNIALLSKETVSEFCETLGVIKKNNLYDELLCDRAVSAKLGKSESASEIDELVMPDGSIRVDRVNVSLSVGSRFIFGNNNRLWRILEVDEEKNTMLVISDKAVCKNKYHEKEGPITWEQCTLRKWLNEEFINEEFSEEEREAILVSHLKNPDNPKYGTEGGNDTDDKIFLLSIEEVLQYFKDEQFKDDNDRNIHGDWWLRTSGSKSSFAAYACPALGNVNMYGAFVYLYSAVHPAFRVDLQSEILRSMIKKDASGDPIIETPKMIVKSGVLVYANRNLKTVNLPEYVKKIADYAFENCTELTEISWAGKTPTIENHAFVNCPKLKLPSVFYTGTKLPHEDFAKFMPSDHEVIANVLLSVSRYHYWEAIEQLDADNACSIADELLKQAPNKKTVKDPDLIYRFVLATAPVLGNERLKSMQTLLNKIKMRGVKWKPLLKREVEKNVPVKKTISRDMFDVEEKLLYADWEELDRLPRLAEIMNAVYVYKKEYGNGSVDPKEYRKAALEYTIHPENNALVSEMNHDALMSLLKKWAKNIGSEWYAPYAVFADDKDLEELLSEMKTWEKDRNLRRQIICVRDAVLLNDTVTAMRYADKMGLLGRYAEMRNMNEDDIRDNILSDFGMDRDGKRTWMLSGKKLIATVNRDLTVTLSNEEGKVLKSVPKKGADPQEYETVNKEFTELKKGVKPTAKIRNDRIFDDFLSGREREAKTWKDAYLNNPVLRILASLIVWKQDTNTFTLNENGEPITVNGDTYVIAEGPIGVAHPMEMDSEEIEAWQKYFNENELKQPFEQIWEPVADKDSVKPGRYDDCTIPLHILMNKEKHGIIMEGQSTITLKGCSAGLKLIEGHHDWYNNDFKITDFKYDIWNRQVNHIVVYLDKGTVAGRVKKDDISVAQWFDRFTLAQIMEFINIANEAQAYNVLAQLMEYRDTHYAYFDPMDEFTLDL